MKLHVYWYFNGPQPLSQPKSRKLEILNPKQSILLQAQTMDRGPQVVGEIQAERGYLGSGLGFRFGV